jgi:hypothetical protein
MSLLFQGLPTHKNSNLQRRGDEGPPRCFGVKFIG